MKIYTSYFGNLKKIPEHILPVSIARFPPKWFFGESMQLLAPPKKLLWMAKQGKISEDEYTIEYMKAIELQFNPQTLFDKLKNMFDDSDIAILCFEKKGEFCHRRLLAAWLKQGLGIDVNEL